MLIRENDLPRKTGSCDLYSRVSQGLSMHQIEAESLCVYSLPRVVTVCEGPLTKFHSLLQILAHGNFLNRKECQNIRNIHDHMRRLERRRFSELVQRSWAPLAAHDP